MYVGYKPEEIRRAMRRKGLTPRKIDRRANGKVTHTTVYALMKGEYKTAQRAKVETLARVLGIPVEDLLED
jgi:hypothetical protein